MPFNDDDLDLAGRGKERQGSHYRRAKRKLLEFRVLALSITSTTSTTLTNSHATTGIHRQKRPIRSREQREGLNIYACPSSATPPTYAPLPTFCARTFTPPNFLAYNMPAPTALQRAPEALAENADTSMADAAVPIPENNAPLLDMDTTAAPVEILAQPSEEQDAPTTDESGRPNFPASGSIPLAFKRERRNVPVPPHRMSPLKTAWPKIYPPLVEHLKLQVRMNTSKKSVELRTSSLTTDTGALQKGYA